MDLLKVVKQKYHENMLYFESRYSFFSQMLAWSEDCVACLFISLFLWYSRGRNDFLSVSIHVSEFPDFRVPIPSLRLYRSEFRVRFRVRDTA